MISPFSMNSKLGLTEADSRLPFIIAEIINPLSLSLSNFLIIKFDCGTPLNPRKEYSSQRFEE